MAYACEAMSGKRAHPTEKTAKGLEVRVPKRSEFVANLKKVAKVPRKGSTTRGTRK